MSIQSSIDGFAHGGSSPPVDRYPDPPDDDELQTVIAPTDLYDFPVNQVAGIDDLRRRLRDIIFYQDDTLEAWSKLLGEYISYGNKKVAKTTAIFNVGSAHDCPNLGTPACQVDEDDCYAVRSETNYPHPLDSRRKQAIIFSLLDGHTWARAFRRHYERKRNAVDSLRFNESGDFQNRHQILKLETISTRLTDIVDTYTYSASADLPWEEVTTATVNQSNDFREFGAREYTVVDTTEAIPDDGIRCPNDLDESIKCGDCKLCVTDGADDVYVKNFYANADADPEPDSDVPALSEYAETIATALPDGWQIQSLEQELNTARDGAVLFDGVLTHEPSNSIVQIVPQQTANTEGYDANRVRVQNNASQNEYYVGLSSAAVDLPAEGVTTMSLDSANIPTGTGTDTNTDQDHLLEHADFPAQRAVHAESSPTTTDTETTFWTPDMAVIATLAAVRSVSATVVTQSALSAF